MPTLDLDILNEEAARACEDHVREQYEEKGPILVRIGKPPKRAIPFRTIEPFAKFVVNLTAPNGSEEKIEFLGRRRAGRGVRNPPRDQAALSLAWRRAGRDQARRAALHLRGSGAHAGRRAGADPGRALRLQSAPKSGRASARTRATARTPARPIAQRARRLAISDRQHPGRPRAARFAARPCRQDDCQSV